MDKHGYSVPYQLVHKRVEVRSTQTTVEIFCNGKRVAAHARSPHPGRFTTVHEHMPRAHREHAEWTPERLVRWAQKVGGHTEELVSKILASRPHPQHGFRACLGILRLGRQYGEARLDAACKRALALNSLTYKSVESILKNGLDKNPLPEAQAPLGGVNN